MANTTGFLKGVGVGLIVGAAVTAAVVPVDKRKLMHSGTGRTLRALGNVLDHLT